MTRKALRIGHALAIAAALGSGVLAVMSKPAEAQDGATCWKEWCTASGSICWAVKIRCPA